MVAKHERGHRFDYWDRARQNTRIVASAGRKRSLLLCSTDGFLLECDRCRRFKRNANVNVFAIGNATLHAARVVRDCANPASADFECIVVLRAPHPSGRKSRADLKTFCRRNAQHRFRQVRFELVEYGFAKTWGHAAHHTLNYAADGVTCVPNLLDERDHLFGSGRIRTTDDIFLNVAHRNGRTVDLRHDFMNLCHIRDDFEVRVQG